MKNIIKKTIVCILALVCCLSACFGVAAETYLTYYGYKYTIINNLSISLAGWDNRTPELIVPNAIEKRNVVSISNSAFENNTEITSVSFSGVKYLNYIGSYSFYGCTGISSPVIIPNCVSDINDSAFMYCTSLPEIQISNGVKNIPQQCFYGCTSLRSVKLFEGLESIGRIAFMNCTSLEYVEIPKSVIEINSNSFKNDDNLTYTDSYAHQYAVENEIPFILVDAPKLGDVNGDGSIDVYDALIVQKYSVDLVELNDEELARADVNHDNSVDVYDATLIQKHAVGKYIIK